jgi:hypothetical protein
MSAAAVLLFFAAVMVIGALVAWRSILPPRDFSRDDFELNGWTDWKREQEGRSDDADGE